MYMNMKGDASWHHPLVHLFNFMKIEPDLVFRFILLINPHAAATHVKGMEEVFASMAKQRLYNL